MKNQDRVLNDDFVKRGLNEETVRAISKIKNEPKWMLDFRLKSLKAFFEMDMPKWAPNFEIDFDDLIFYLKMVKKSEDNWEKVPKDIKKIFDALGIPEEERRFLSGSGAQYESEMIYNKVKEELLKQGVVFMSMDEGLKKYENLVKEYFGTLIAYNDNKYAALNSAVWSGGTFLYVPKGVKVKLPLQTYFTMNFEATGQFERTLIIVEENASVQYIEGCTAKLYSKANLHAGVVEVFVKRNAKMRYSTVQNWSKNVLNLTTKRGLAEENALIEWIDGNLGSGINMKYPAIILKGDHSKANVLGIAFASKNQNVDTGAKIISIGKNTKAKVISKGISLNSGIHSYRGLVKVLKGSEGSSINVNCDALIMDDVSISNTYPKNVIKEKKSIVKHEATVGKIDEDVLFYLKSRGISEEDAKTMIVLGFLDEVSKELPFEYAIEFNKLMKLEMKDAIG